VTFEPYTDGSLLSGHVSIQADVPQLSLKLPSLTAAQVPLAIARDTASPSSSLTKDSIGHWWVMESKFIRCRRVDGGDVAVGIVGAAPVCRIDPGRRIIVARWMVEGT